MFRNKSNQVKMEIVEHDDVIQHTSLKGIINDMATLTEIRML